jgi:hypothetical protein
MKTYQVAAPRSTHTRPATCAEVDCGHWRHGWATRVDERTDLGMAQAAYIRAECVSASTPASPAGRARRRYVETRTPEGLTEFAFPGGQQCFAEDHRVPLERPELFIVRGGDWRGNPTGQHRQHKRPDDWVEDFAEHQQRIATQIQKG